MTVAALALFELRDDQTIVVTTIVLFQVFYLLECRSLRHSILHVGLWTNPWALAGIAGVLALQVAFIYAPPMHDVFGSAPLSAEDWLLALAAAATVLPVVGVEKWWRRRDRSFPHRKPGVSPMTGRAVRRDDRRQRLLRGELR